MIKKAEVFIVGMPRSGTTLLTNILNASEQIYFGYETHFFEVLDKWNRTEKKNSLIDFYLNTNGNTNQNIQYLPLPSNIKEDILNLNFHTPKDLFEYILKVNSPNHYIIAEKTPSHYKHIDLIKSVYPDAKFIFVLRDPRDIYLSQKKTPWGIKNPFEFVLLYRSFFSVFETSKESNNVCFIKYEDLIDSPVNTMTPIFDFLQLNFSPTYVDKAQNNKYSNFKISLEPWKKNNLKNISSDSSFKWKKAELNSELKTISLLLSRKISKLGYPSVSVKKLSTYVYIFRYSLSFLIKKISRYLS